MRRDCRSAPEQGYEEIVQLLERPPAWWADMLAAESRHRRRLG